MYARNTKRAVRENIVVTLDDFVLQARLSPARDVADLKQIMRTVVEKFQMKYTTFVTIEFANHNTQFAIVDYAVNPIHGDSLTPAVTGGDWIRGLFLNPGKRVITVVRREREVA